MTDTTDCRIRDILGREKDGEWLLAQYESDLKRMTPEQFEIDLLARNRIGWNHPTFDKIKNKIKDQDDYLLNPYEVEEGVVTCNKCGSNKVFSVSVQTRAADEPMTTIAQCVRCKSKWTYSG